MARVATQCAQCGQVDDHPKVHVGDVTKHHDCMAAAERAMVVESSEQAASIVTACEGGQRGDDLLRHIVNIHPEPTPEA